jgi:hypothetical protein
MRLSLSTWNIAAGELGGGDERLVLDFHAGEFSEQALSYTPLSELLIGASRSVLA